jgi:hypothetical protein
LDFDNPRSNGAGEDRIKRPNLSNSRLSSILRLLTSTNSCTCRS